MKKNCIILLLAVFCYSANAQDSYQKYLWLTKSLTNESIANVEAETSGGNIELMGVDADARIEVYIQGSNGKGEKLSKEEITARLDRDYDLDISTADHKLTAIARHKKNSNSWKHGLSISFRIYVPHQSSSHVVTSGGNISIGNLSGTEDSTTSGGNLMIDQVSGHIKGVTSGGNVNLSNSQDDIDLSTSGGNVVAKNSQGNIKLRTSGGNVGLTDLQGNITATTSGGNVEAKTIAGELQASTSGGNVRLLDLSCSLDASTSGGNIKVEIIVPGKYVKLRNSGGNIELQMPDNKGYDLKLYAEKLEIPHISNFSGTGSNKKMEGTINGGGIPVTVDAGDGKVFLTFK